MKLAVIRRPIESTYSRSKGGMLPGRVIYTEHDFINREIIFLIEHDDGLEIPEIVEISTCPPS
jgi:hypothetical protein